MSISQVEVGAELGLAVAAADPQISHSQKVFCLKDALMDQLRKYNNDLMHRVDFGDTSSVREAFVREAMNMIMGREMAEGMPEGSSRGVDAESSPSPAVPVRERRPNALVATCEGQETPFPYDAVCEETGPASYNYAVAFSRLGEELLARGQVVLAIQAFAALHECGMRCDERFGTEGAAKNEFSGFLTSEPCSDAADSKLLFAPSYLVVAEDEVLINCWERSSVGRREAVVCANGLATCERFHTDYLNAGLMRYDQFDIHVYDFDGAAADLIHIAPASWPRKSTS